MSEFITLTCPSCSGKLQITEDIDCFACAHCGNEHVVKRSGGVVSLKPVLEQVSKGVDNTASELAIVRLDKEIKSFQVSISELRSIREITKNSNSKETKVFIIGLGAIILGALLISEFSTCGLILILVGIGSFIILYRLKKENKKSLNEAQEALKHLENKHAELEKERKYHRDKVGRN